MRIFAASLTAAIATLAALGCSDATDPAGDELPPVIGSAALGAVSERFTAELWVHGNTAYTTTWGSRMSAGVSAPGNAIKIWDVSGNAPVLVDSVIVSGASTLGDIQASADGSLLVVATEFSPGSIVIYSLANPRKPVQLARFSSANTQPGVHTAELQRVNGKLYAFLSVDPRSNPATPARLVIVDLSNPAAPIEIASRIIGRPYQHDVFVRDGILFTAEWHDGMSIWDIGGAGRGGSVANPVRLGNVATVGGSAHNVWWYHDASGGKKYAFVGEEAPGQPSAGDIHVVDVSDFDNPKEVAFFSVPGAGTHNFWMDEARGFLYAAYYNAGVRVLDMRGDLSACAAAHRSSDGRCNLALMGRERARALDASQSRGPSFHLDGDGHAHGPGDAAGVYVWGVHGSGGRVFASDMQQGLWRLAEGY